MRHYRFLLLFTGLFLVSLSASAIQVGDYAPSVDLDGWTSEGKEIKIDIRKLEKPGHAFTMLQFFTTWCPTCEDKVGFLQSELNRKMTFRLVSLDRNPASVKKFLEKHNLKVAVVFDDERVAYKVYEAKGIPTFYLLDFDYNVVFTRIGVLSTKDVAEIINIVLD